MNRSKFEAAELPWPIGSAIPQPLQLPIPALATADVWFAHLDRLAFPSKEDLTDDEWARANRYLKEEVRQDFLRGRFFCRRILAGYLKLSHPSAVEFTWGSHGKPRLAPAGSLLEFNLSHSMGGLLLAVASGQPVGIDLECQKADREILGLAKRYFSEQEIAELERLPVTDQLAGFYNGWARKEAFIKATGLGLGFPLGRFTVSLAPAEPAKLRWIDPSLENLDRWQMLALPMGPRWSAALVITKPLEAVRFFAVNSANAPGRLS